MLGIAAAGDGTGAVRRPRPESAPPLRRAALEPFLDDDARHDDAEEDQQDRDGQGVEQGRLHAADDSSTGA